MEVRAATIDDAEAVADVHVRSWRAAYPGLIPQDFLDNLQAEHRLPGWRRILDETAWPRQGVLVLVPDLSNPSATASGPDPVGFAHVCPTRDDDRDPAAVGEITSIYLLDSVWGTAGGRQLMAAALEALRAGGYETATLWALDTNARARRFYERGGWRVDGSTKEHDWGSFVCTDVRYVLPLT